MKIRARFDHQNFSDSSRIGVTRIGMPVDHHRLSEEDLEPPDGLTGMKHGRGAKRERALDRWSLRRDVGVECCD